MSITEFGALGEGIGSLLILVTLVYLAIQNRQQHKLLLSNTFQTRIGGLGQVIGWVVENPQFAEVLRKSEAEEPLTPSESQQLQFYSVFRHKLNENSHYQLELDLLKAFSESNIRSSIGDTLASSEARSAWRRFRGIFSADYVSLVDEIIQDTEQDRSSNPD